MDELSRRLLAGIDHKAAKTAIGVTWEFMTGARGKIGDVLGEIVGAPPDLSQFV